MKQALHIFAKDVRRLWLPILISLAGIVAFAWVESQPVSGQILNEGGLLKLFIVFGWLYLTARLVHQETLPGDRQFWLSRPYSRFSLCIAKLSFGAVFLALPFLMGSIVILRSGGFEILPALPGLLVRLFFFAALCWLPALALATISRGLGSYALGAFLAFAGFYLAGIPFMSGERWTLEQIRWIHLGVMEVTLFVGAAAVVAWQYRTRRTGIGALALSAIVPAAVIGFWYLPLEVACSLGDTVRPEPSSVHSVAFSVDTSAAARLPIASAPSIIPVGTFPYRLTGLPKDSRVQTDAAVARTSDGDQIIVGTNAPWYGALNLFLKPKQLGRFSNRQVRITGAVWLTALRPRQLRRAPFGEPVTLPGIGHCRSDRDQNRAWICCTFPLKFSHQVEIELIARDTGERTRPQTIAHAYDHSPLPAEPGFSPLHHAFALQPLVVKQFRAGRGPSAPIEKPIEQYDVEYRTAEPVARIRREFVIESVLLSPPRDKGQ